MSYNFNQSYAATQYFPQPTGNAYLINNSLEVSNIPMGAGISVAICPSESTMYIKTLQGGAPSLMVYNIIPYEAKTKQDSPSSSTNYEERFQEIAAQIAEIKKQITGGKINELL